jgi:hypothetical protein
MNKWFLAGAAFVLLTGCSCASEEPAVPKGKGPSDSAVQTPADQKAASDKSAQDNKDSPRPQAGEGPGVRAGAERAGKPSVQTPAPKRPTMVIPPSMKGVAKKGPDGRMVDDFGLPLDIQMDVPEVPPEIQGPSPPIKD